MIILFKGTQVADYILTIVFDGTVFGLTLSRTWQVSRQARAAGIRTSLYSLLLRDGEDLFTYMYLNIPQGFLAGSLYFG